MQFGVKEKLRAFAAFGIVATLVVGLVGYNSEQKLGDALTGVNIKMAALRNHMESDMMHDALRADVLSALRAAKSHDEAAHKQVVADIEEHIASFIDHVDQNAKAPLSDEIKAGVEDVRPALSAYADAAREITAAAFKDIDSAEAKMPEFLAAFKELEGRMSSLSDLIETDAKNAEEQADATAASGAKWIMAMFLLSAVAAIVVSVFLIRGITSPLDRLYQAIQALRSEDGSATRLDGFRHEFEAVQTAFNGVLDDIDARRKVEQERADAAMRVQQALNAAEANVVLSNDAMEVVYVNDTAQAMFQRYAGDIKRDLSNFNAAAMVGRNMDQFYTDRSIPAALERLSTPRTDELHVGGKTFSVTATPVRGEHGERLGVVCEWVDLTEQREAERQIQSVLGDAIAGRLDSRLQSDSFRGFTRSLAESVNQMLDAITAPLTVAAEHLKGIADGKIPAPITTEFHGAFNDIKTNLNTCSDVLRAMIEDATALVDAAGAGQLDKRAELDRHWGDFRKIVEGMNAMLDAMAGPVSSAREVMTGLAGGDLSGRMAGDYQGEFAVLRDAMDTSVENLANMVARIGQSANSIGTSATEIAKGNQDLNRRTQEQAASIEETSAAIQSLTQRVQENTGNARQANQLASSARTEAEKGGQVVADAINAMTAINTASSKIADIISVIDGIAFQTNLLALNAAVEAARAGEQGRGFAVVASEVRNLAQNSAAAAREIKVLIGDSVDKVNHGTQLVNDSGTTLRDIVGAVKSVSDIIAEITAASEEQLSGIEQVNKALSQLDEVTQQNAALVEEATAASESMDDETRALTELMSFFKGGKREFMAPPAPSAAPVNERRKANRPWSGSAASAPTVSAPRVASVANGDDVWNEF
ncbi:MAG: MCP four helix bundle domain-containing protein [Gammaproteobacteria bacterium]|nr:MCP four helix bundle domain-containing protein [Gammaproteobacteria bacterium]